ncbi:hypothetical protein MTsPCn9_20870 [Croceitalea sp. MTPC9]|uniref:hypothetical protein n=1 Tax=unclassified Croceitalea TaxID=2632280 RepID=UPI002B3BDDEB|nr:hypothetical protein MTsPCn6_25390 [Croceitalea sp. MTPC6]GMN17151.1 hypothetical protein MTsPCn9_20870 [Croceitalea sp. MTPC9]
MKRIVLLTLIGLFVTTTNQAQEQEIEMKVNFWGYKFMKDGERLNWKELQVATIAVENANLLIKKARGQHTTSIILAVVGGGLLGWNLGQASNEDDPDYTLAYVGGGIAAVSMGFSISAFNKVNKGVDLYNLSVNKTAHYQFQPELQVMANGNGVGLAMRF